MQTIRLANLNAHKLKPTTPGSSSWRADSRAVTIREMKPDICTMQEFLIDEAAVSPASWGAKAAELIRAFAAACELTAVVGATDGHPHGVAMAANSHRPWFTAILYNPDTVQVVDRSYRPYGAPDYWHGCTTLEFDIGTREPLRVASYHGDPFRPEGRNDEAKRLKSLCRAVGGARPGVIMGDFNSVSAARLSRRWWQLRGRYYDAEPYATQEHDDLEYQVLQHRIGRRFLRQLADRQPTEALLRRGYMVDAAAHLGAPWQPTVGHWTDGQGDPDPWGPRRIDLILASRPVAPALISYHTHRSTAALEGADHLPIYADIAPSEISGDR